MAKATPTAGGLLLLDKPAGISSNQALGKAKRILGIRKAGHAGTLDPFATGLLLCAFGQATKVNAFLLEADKTYQATLQVGQSTATGDLEGAVTATSQVPAISRQQWQALADKLTGTIEQVPPMYSALKHQGQPLYKLARQGKTIERQARQVTIHSLDIVSWQAPLLVFQVRCSKGTYVRTLGEQLAQLAGSIGHLTALRRTSIGGFEQHQMLTLTQLEAAPEPLACLLPADQALLDYPAITLSEQQATGFLHGRTLVEVAVDQPGKYRVYAVDGLFLGLGECLRGAGLKPQRVFPAG